MKKKCKIKNISVFNKFEFKKKKITATAVYGAQYYDLTSNRIFLNIFFMRVYWNFIICTKYFMIRICTFTFKSNPLIKEYYMSIYVTT